MARAYKLSNSERQTISSVKELYEKRIIRVFTIDDYYLYDLNVLKMTEKLFRTFHVDCSSIDDQEIKKRKMALPIDSIKDLSITGNDLIQWTECKAGQWIGEWMKKIEFAVLHGKCKNDSNHIKEWFML